MNLKIVDLGRVYKDCVITAERALRMRRILAALARMLPGVVKTLSCRNFRSIQPCCPLLHRVVCQHHQLQALLLLLTITVYPKAPSPVSSLALWSVLGCCWLCLLRAAYSPREEDGIGVRPAAFSISKPLNETAYKACNKSDQLHLTMVTRFFREAAWLECRPCRAPRLEKLHPRLGLFLGPEVVEAMTLLIQRSIARALFQGTR